MATTREIAAQCVEQYVPAPERETILEMLGLINEKPGPSGNGSLDNRPRATRSQKGTCGTNSGRKAHMARGESAADCAVCGPWWAAYMVNYRAERRAA